MKGRGRTGTALLAAVLADQLPENHGGLELPIHGATGYTSVELPLWDDLSTRETAAVPPAETASAVPTETLPAATPTPTPPSPTEGALAVLSPGTAFVVLRESGEFWQVECVWKGHQITGWLEHRYCMVNLPDVLPSMVYNATNTYDSQFRACGQSLEGITGQALYGAGKTYNPRLGEADLGQPGYRRLYHHPVSQPDPIAPDSGGRVRRLEEDYP